MNNNILIPKYVDGECIGSNFIDFDTGNQELSTVYIKKVEHEDAIDALIYALSLKENESPFPSDIGVNIKDIIDEKKLIHPDSVLARNALIK